MILYSISFPNNFHLCLSVTLEISFHASERYFLTFFLIKGNKKSTKIVFHIELKIVAKDKWTVNINVLC